MPRVETIGDCGLHLGDALEIIPTLGLLDCIVSDPPFGMNYRSARRSEQHEDIAGDCGSDLIKWAADLEALHSKYLFARWDNLRELPPPKSAITWVKNNWTSGDLDHAHARQTELILFYAGADHQFPNGRPNDVIECPKVTSDDHPTEKPRQLLEVIVGWTSGLVVDPFMGSGSTGAACAMLGRSFVGCEIVPAFFDLACRRIEAAYRAPRFL